MRVVKVRGIVINSYDSGESDKILIVLSKDLGRIRISCRGARKAKSKYMAGAQLFTYSDFVLFSGKDFYSATQIDIIESFQYLRSDYERICYGNYFLELIDKTSFENAPSEEILHLLLKSLYALNSQKYKPEFIARIFEFKFMQLSGYQPEALYCTDCGEGAQEAGGQYYFGIEGCICKDCVQNRHYAEKVGYGCLYTINYIMDADIKNIFNFTVNDQILKDLKRASDIFMKNIDVKLKSKELLESL